MEGRSQAWNQRALAIQNWFCPVLNWESTDLSWGEGDRGRAWQHEPPSYPESHSLKDVRTAGAIFQGEGFIASSDSQRGPQIRNFKNKAEQTLRGRFAERDFPTCKLFEKLVIWELLAPGSRN